MDSWNSVSDRSISHYLSCYTQITHTDLTVVPSKVWRRLFLAFGHNFPVSLSVETRVPVLIVSEKNNFAGKVSNILYPVIDPKRWADGFHDLLDFARICQAKITLLYRPYSDATSGYWTSKTIQFGAIPFYEPSTLLKENSKLEVLSTWINAARKKGVPVELKLDKQPRGLMECILEYHRDVGFDLIALDPAVLESSDFNQAWEELGREAVCPLWIARPLGQSSHKDALQQVELKLRWAR